MLISILSLWAALVVQETAPVDAHIQMNAPERHFYQIEMTFPASSEDERILKMAVWTPGSYKVRDFAKNVELFRAFSEDGQPLSFEKTDKSTWRVQAPAGQAFKITYELFAYEHTVRTSYLDVFGGFINPASALFYEPVIAAQPIQVRVTPQEGWSAASPLPPIGENHWRAANWDALVDSPFQFGPFRRHEFEVRDIPHYWLIGGDVDMNDQEMVLNLQKMAETVVDIFGGFPFQRYYIFSIFRLQGAGGGLEHGNSTMVMGSSLQMRTKRGWDRFLSLMIHEYFHAWNVKAIRDRVLGPFDYQTENYTEFLWLHEGWTSYYDTLLMRRAEFWSEKELLDAFAKEIDRYRQKPGVTRQSLVDASFNAWIHQYQANQNTPNGRVSYYSDAAVSGLALDLLIRHRTKGEKSLDDVLADLYQTHALQGRGIGWEELTETLEKIGGPATIEFLDRHVKAPNPIPMETYLEYAGLTFSYAADREKAADEASDEDGEQSEKAKEKKPKPFAPNPKVDMGVSTRTSDDRVFIRSVRRDGPGWNAGLDFGDELISINDRRILGRNLNNILGLSRPGDEVKVVVSRDARLLELDLVLEALPEKPQLKLVKEPTELQDQIYQALFRLKPKEDKTDDKASEE